MLDENGNKEFAISDPLSNPCDISNGGCAANEKCEISNEGMIECTLIPEGSQTIFPLYSKIVDQTMPQFSVFKGSSAVSIAAVSAVSR